MMLEVIVIAGVTLLILSAFLSALILMIRYYMYHYGQGERSPELTATSTEAAVHTLDAFFRKLRRFPDLKKLISVGQPKEQLEFGTYVIPGLRAARTLAAGSGFTEMCTTMTPQGLAVTEDYLFISAYCHEHVHNSVIYMIDRHTHKYIKEIVLPEQTHAGGLTYDTLNNVLWVSGHKNHTAYANAYTLGQILNYDFHDADSALSYTYQCPLPGIERNSFMSYRDGSLYVGYFNLKDRGVIQRYFVGDCGCLIPDQEGNYMPDESSAIPAKIQGMTFAQEFVILVGSYGLRFSEMFVYRQPSGNEGFCADEKWPSAVYTLPDRLENVCYYDGKFYMLYESASSAYRRRTFFAVDRVITCHIDGILADFTKNRERTKKNG